VRVDPGNAGGALCPKLSKRTKNDKLIDLLLNSHLIAELFDSVGQALDGSLLVQKEVQDSSPCPQRPRSMPKLIRGSGRLLNRK